MNSIKKYSTFYFLLYFLGLITWSFLLFISDQKTSPFNYLFNLAYAALFLLAGVLAYRGMQVSGLKNTVGRELLSISIAMTTYSIALFIWSYYNLVLQVETPYPSLADVFFVLYIPFLGYGIINLLRGFGILFTAQTYLEFLLIFIFAGIFVFGVVTPNDPLISQTLIEKVFNVYYVMGDAVLITLGIMLIRLSRGRIHVSFFFLISALFVMAYADFLFINRNASEIYWNGDISDVFYALAAVLFCLSVTQIVETQSKIAALKKE